MIEQRNCPITYNDDDNNHIATLPSPLGITWDKPTARTRVLKSKIRTQLDAVQFHCAYCGLELGGTSAGEIDHIAPKARTKNPEFTYTPANLILACNYCNGPKKKFQQETIAIKNANYNACTFLIVHPYFDNPNVHYSWIDNANRIIIQSISDKGTATINMFELDSPRMTRFRAIEYNTYIMENNLILDNETEQQLKAALMHK